ncbi:MAG: LapA family protein [Proteobacteria bacterium]|nr:LapA family protein [Pseudomonadota bacterium]MBU1709160.1 LapA family protein [Pseudomonadota bacterium]
MQQVKLILILVLVSLGLIIVLQNTQPVETKILFASITMPRAVLLFGTTILGFALGVLVSFMMVKRDRNDTGPHKTE